MVLSGHAPSRMVQTCDDDNSPLECNIYPLGVIIYQFWIVLCALDS